MSDLLKSGIPVEICPTSNLKTRAIQAIDSHPFGELLRAGHPMSICTDDSGVFNISLASEYHLIASAFALSKAQLWNISRSAIELIFDDDTTKQMLREKFNMLKPIDC